MEKELFNEIKKNFNYWVKELDGKYVPTENAKNWFRNCFEYYVDAYINELKYTNDNTLSKNINDDAELTKYHKKELDFGYADDDLADSVSLERFLENL